MRGRVSKLLKRVATRTGAPVRVLKRAWKDSTHVERRETRRKLLKTFMLALGWWLILHPGTTAAQRFEFATLERCETVRKWLVYTPSTPCRWEAK